jgi:hypothetical protein
MRDERNTAGPGRPVVATSSRSGRDAGSMSLTGRVRQLVPESSCAESCDHPPPLPPSFVLLWLSCALRTEHNPALEHAATEANRRQLPLLALFAIDASFPGATERSFAFLLEGLRELVGALRSQRAVQLLVLRGPPPEVVRDVAAHGAALLVADVGYTRVSRAWHQGLVDARLLCPFDVVETEVVVPVAIASQREEPAAATLRPKLRRHFGQFLRPLPAVAPAHSSLHLGEQGGAAAVHSARWQELALPPDDEGGISAALDQLDTSTCGGGGKGRIDRSAPRVESFRGGAAAAADRLRWFIAHKLPGFATHRKDPIRRYQSHLSPYLHFGFISPVTVALAVLGAKQQPVSTADEKASSAGPLVCGSERGGELLQQHGPCWPCAPKAESGAIYSSSAAAGQRRRSSGGGGGGGSASPSAGAVVTSEDVEAYLVSAMCPVIDLLTVGHNQLSPSSLN